MWSTTFICICTVLSVSAYSKYGRTCKDIGCLNSEICVLAEDPCSYGRTSECGTYPTCKKKTAADGETHNVPPTKATTPRPIAELKPHDDIPNYPPPPPPRQPSYGGNNYNGGGYSGGGGGYPSGGGSNGYSGGSGYPGYSGGGSQGHGGSGYPGYGGGSSSGGGSSNGGLSNIFNSFGFGGGSSGSNGQGGGSNPISSILTNLLSNITKNGFPSLNPSLTRPGLIENRNTNPNYPANTYGLPSNGQYPSNTNGQNYPGYYPSYNQPQNQPNQQNGYVARNYAGINTATRNYATTRKPVSYGWNIGISILTLLFVRIAL